MKKTKTTKSVVVSEDHKPISTLPADFSTDENAIEHQSAHDESKDKQSPTPEEIQKVEDTPLPIPSIDQDASLKIEEAEMMSEELPQQEKQGKLLFVIGSIISLIIIAGAIFLSVLYFKTPEEKKIVTETAPTPIVTETIKIELKKADFNFEVLNASGISGQAGKTKALLEANGYTVSAVGNANSQETNTKLLLKASLLNQKDLLISNLQAILPGLVYGGEFDSETVNARIIIGE